MFREDIQTLYNILNKQNYTYYIIDSTLCYKCHFNQMNKPTIWRWNEIIDNNNCIKVFQMFMLIKFSQARQIVK